MQYVTCPDCGHQFEHTLDNFYPVSRSTYLMNICKKCYSKRTGKYHQEHREQRLEQIRRWHQDNIEYIRQYRKARKQRSPVTKKKRKESKFVGQFYPETIGDTPRFIVYTAQRSPLRIYIDGYTFSWPDGPGSIELAYSILRQLTTQSVADLYCQQFHEDVIAKLKPDAGFELTYRSVREWLLEHTYRAV